MKNRNLFEKGKGICYDKDISHHSLLNMIVCLCLFLSLSDQFALILVSLKTAVGVVRTYRLFFSVQNPSEIWDWSLSRHLSHEIRKILLQTKHNWIKLWKSCSSRKFNRNARFIISFPCSVAHQHWFTGNLLYLHLLLEVSLVLPTCTTLRQPTFTTCDIVIRQHTLCSSTWVLGFRRETLPSTWRTPHTNKVKDLTLISMRYLFLCQDFS